MTLKFSKHELERIVGHTLRPSDRLSRGDYEKLETAWRASLKPDTLWEAEVRARHRSAYSEKTRNSIRGISKDLFREREGLNPDGSQDPVCNILGPGSHHWMTHGDVLGCACCGDVDLDWVPGWCPSGWCRCDPKMRDTGWCLCVHYPDSPDDEEGEAESEFDLIGGVPRADKHDLERCTPRHEGKVPETVWEEGSVWTGDVPTTLKDLRKLGAAVGISKSSKNGQRDLAR